VGSIKPWVSTGFRFEGYECLSCEIDSEKALVGRLGSWRIRKGHGKLHAFLDIQPDGILYGRRY